MRALMHSKAMRLIVEQTNAVSCKSTRRSSMEEKVHEVLMMRMYTMRTSILPGQSAGAIRNAQMHDIKPQVIGCISWWVEEDRRVDGTTGNGAATG